MMPATHDSFVHQNLILVLAILATRVSHFIFCLKLNMHNNSIPKVRITQRVTLFMQLCKIIQQYILSLFGFQMLSLRILRAFGVSPRYLLLCLYTPGFYSMSLLFKLIF